MPIKFSFSDPKLSKTLLKVISLAAVVSMLIVSCKTAVTGEQINASSEGSKFSEFVDAQGNISLPVNYRTTFSHLGTYSVASKTGGMADELHGVYTRPNDALAYNQNGKFPDGAILVKEVYSTKSEPLTTGDVSWASTVKIWFVMIKDSKGRFKGNNLWGDGWGWALFEAKNPLKQVANDYKSECRACHVPAKKDDWLYIGRFPGRQLSTPTANTKQK